MLECNRVDLSEGADIKESEENSKECSLCKFRYYVDRNFKYQTYLCDGCHDMSMKAMSMQNFTIVYRGGNAYRVNFAFMTKNEALNLIEK